MRKVLNRNNFKNLINSVDIPCDNKTRTKVLDIFMLGLAITQNEITHADINTPKKTLNVDNLISEIDKINKSTREILTLVLHRIVQKENFNVAPIEWLTAESLLNLLKFSHTCIFPVSGENLFLRWCYVFSNNLQDGIDDIKEQINNISLPAKILIYNEVVKWRTSKYKDYNFDLFLQFLSFLHEEEVNNILLKEKDAV